MVVAPKKPPEPIEEWPLVVRLIKNNELLQYWYPGGTIFLYGRWMGESIVVVKTDKTAGMMEMWVNEPHCEILCDLA